MEDLSARFEVARQLVEASWEDADLRESLLANPKEQLQELLNEGENGLQLPDFLKVRFIEEEPGEIVFVLPQNPDDEVLSQEQLAMAAGGRAAAGLKWSLPDINLPGCESKTAGDGCRIRIGCNKTVAPSDGGDSDTKPSETTGTKYV
jgi:hypothetical protein